MTAIPRTTIMNGMSGCTYSIELTTVSKGYDRKTCWVHARAGLIPPQTPIITAQKLRLTDSDVFYTINVFRSDDAGATWHGPSPQEGLSRRDESEGVEVGPSDFTPGWHAATGTLLGTGHTVRYRDDTLVRGPYRRQTVYSVYDRSTQAWSPWTALSMPEDGKFFNAGAGCTQRVDLEDGTILLPFSFKAMRSEVRKPSCSSSAVMRLAFDGQTLTYLEHGDELTVPELRGLGEASLARFGGRFVLTLRNDRRGYVCSGSDGLGFGEPAPWTFDDGEELGNYNTQQHWLTHSDALFLVYTRRGADNDHVFRHRAPLFMAEVDPERLCVIRETERVVVPERGARLGNFGILDLSAAESWVIAAEWMQTTPPDPHDSTVCERYGSDNSIFVARILWDEPNLLAPT